MRIRDVVDAQAPVAEGVDVDLAVVGRDADVHWDVGPDLRDVLARPRPVLLLVDEHELAREGGRGEGVVVVGQQGPAQLEGGPGHPEGLQRLARVEVPHDHRVAELLHRLRILGQLAEGSHVVLLAREGRREHAVQVGVHPHVVAVGRLLGHPDGPDELAVVAVLGGDRVRCDGE